MDGSIDRWMYGGFDGWMVRWMDRWMVGWLVGWIGGWDRIGWDGWNNQSILEMLIFEKC